MPFLFKLHFPGSSVSNIEANAIIAELHEYNTESKVTISVPASPDGSIKILDEQKELLHSDDVRSVSTILE